MIRLHVGQRQLSSSQSTFTQWVSMRGVQVPLHVHMRTGQATGAASTAQGDRPWAAWGAAKPDKW